MMMKNVRGPVEGVLGPLYRRLLFFWDQSKSTNTGFMTLENQNKPLFVKELKKVWDEHKGFSAKNTLLIDESPHRALPNPPNTAISPSPYDASQVDDAELAPGGDLRVFLEGLAVEGKEVPRYVAKHRIGQEPITEKHGDWHFYSRVVRSISA
ncbi:uncharacterized protein LOC144706761 [Wolffia australiana]